jgi:tRNA nucleotidyltransferase (CCA-adding enzyme)
LSEKGINRIVRSLAIHQKEHDLLLAQRSRGLALLKMVTLPRNEQQTPKNSDIYHWFTGFSLELILYLMARSEDDSLRQSISLFMTRLRNTQIILNGQDLIHLGLPPGRYFQDIFKLLLDARLNEQVYSREDEIALVSQHFQTHR